jgi:hypothetical protein
MPSNFFALGPLNSLSPSASRPSMAHYMGGGLPLSTLHRGALSSFAFFDFYVACPLSPSSPLIMHAPSLDLYLPLSLSLCPALRPTLWPAWHTSAASLSLLPISLRALCLSHFLALSFRLPSREKGPPLPLRRRRSRDLEKNFRAFPPLSSHRLGHQADRRRP